MIAPNKYENEVGHLSCIDKVRVQENGEMLIAKPYACESSDLSTKL
jgi:hypothetical protein